MKKMVIFILVVVAIFVALWFVVNYQQQEQSEGNPYNKSNLHQATIDQLDKEIYQNQILPDELATDLENDEDKTVYFYSPTCPHCQRTTPVVVPLAEELGIDLVKMNLLEFDAQWNVYSIEATPTIVHFEDGEEVARIMGEREESTFRQFFQEKVLDES
ncbi:thioredoxin [Gracilibacillus halophilus YIM-C55.5]|uniref:Thioredoxin n=1 Tax=Gracilibacillus halophilus YIM-C55.5 TaxID=1308866 RepID=N4WQW0_9BACI|nr:thioredoxin family protein [Gracilibacillus halophilus]ENH95581.1 thioredoxin [Gracilibacillus halophilus YIM-C55.5]